ncbi:hypothetical protein CFOL_v3_10448, partial [Cephalotus follicularis]
KSRKREDAGNKRKKERKRREHGCGRFVPEKATREREIDAEKKEKRKGKEKEKRGVRGTFSARRLKREKEERDRAEQREKEGMRVQRLYTLDSPPRTEGNGRRTSKAGEGTIEAEEANTP